MLTRVGQWCRLGLVAVALLVVAWSFLDVGRRAVLRWQENTARPVTLTLLHWGDPAEDRIVRELAERYEAAHPHVRIVRISTSQFDSKLKTMMAAGTPPDLFYLPPRLLPELASLGLIRPIDDYVERLRETPEGRAYLEDVYPILLEGFTFDTQTGRTGEGKLYALPKDSTTAVFYVNLDLVEAAGVTLPAPGTGWTWDGFEAAAGRITRLNGTAGFERRQVYGANFAIWPDTLRNFVWTFGGEFFGPGGFRDVTLDEPSAQAALEMIRRLRLDERTVFNATGVAKDGGQEFFTGNVGFHGPVGRWLVPRLKEGTPFRWDVVAVPYLRPEYAASQLFFTGWTMSAATAHPDEAFRLMLFLCGPEGAAQQSRLGLAIPPMRSVAESADFLAPPGIPTHNARAFLDALSVARISQNPRQPEWDRIVGDQISASIQLGSMGTLENARAIEAAWLAELDSPLRRREWGPVRWPLVIGVTAGLLATAVLVLVLRARAERLGPLDKAQERAGFAFIFPWLAGFVLLTAGPMVLSLILAFSQWTAMTPVADAKWVGMANYRQLVTTDATFVQSLRVTLYFVVLSVPISQVAALGVALLMNLRLRGIAFFRTVYFLPSVISGVALAVLWLQIFHNDYGLLNTVLRPVAVWLGTTPPDWFGVDAARWAIPAFVIMGLWGVGGGMLIYLAGLKGIPQSLYEAATIDGAGPLRRLWNVTLPMLSPLIFYNLVMGIIGSFQVFTQAFVMTGGGPQNATLFYVLSLYRQAFEFHNMGYASAMAWILFVICLLLTLLVFRGSRNLVFYEGLKR